MEAPSGMDQRHVLVPKVVKTLASLVRHDANPRKVNIPDEFTQQAEKHLRSSEWIEQKLRLSLLNATNIEPTPRKTKLTRAANRSRSRDVPAAQSIHIPHSAQFAADITHVRPNAVTDTPVAAEKANDADPVYTNLLRNMHGISTKDAWAAGGDTLDARLTPAPRHGRAVMHPAASSNQQEAFCMEIDDLPYLTGQDQLTHDLQSAFSSQYDNDPDLFQSIDIYPDPYPSNRASYQTSAIETPNTTQQGTLLDQQTTFTTTTNTMDSQNSMQSLSELLGDDSRLASMWQRRRSTCPTAEEEAEQLHNMFLYDPDMKLFNATRKDTLSDTMMFDTYDFSRTTSWSSASSSPSTRSTTSFEQLEQPVPKSTSTSSKRQSSSLKQSSRSSRMSDADILFQQTGSSRTIDIKKRKSSQGYSTRY